MTYLLCFNTKKILERRKLLQLVERRGDFSIPDSYGTLFPRFSHFRNKYFKNGRI